MPLSLFLQAMPARTRKRLPPAEMEKPGCDPCAKQAMGFVERPTYEISVVSHFKTARKI